ncbi:hypothetical protein C8R43DRAFT_1162908 [Mycena crocata]|nr:hypothetical protein C8R43DRAFT_1162908 [Mycena crocata]
MSGKTVYLITGANRGIGYALASAVATRPNAIVFAGARDPAAQSLRDLAAKYSNVRPVKVTSADQADNEAAIAEIAKTAGQLDVIIANAERHIFELSALARPVESPTLMRVAWRVNHCVGDVLNGNEEAGEEDEEDIVATLTGVEKLNIIALWTTHDDSPCGLGALPSLRQLHCASSELFDLCSPVCHRRPFGFATLTHLALRVETYDYPDTQYLALATLLQLTHLAFLTARILSVSVPLLKTCCAPSSFGALRQTSGTSWITWRKLTSRIRWMKTQSSC